MAFRIVAGVRVGSAQCKRLRHFVDTARTERMATRQPPAGEHTAARRAEARDRHACVVSATWVKATTRAEQGTGYAFVDGEQGKQKSGHEVLEPVENGRNACRLRQNRSAAGLTTPRCIRAPRGFRAGIVPARRHMDGSIVTYFLLVEGT